MKASAEYKITTVNTLEEIESIRPIWESIQTHPWADIDHYLNNLNYIPNTTTPHIILLTQNEKPKSLVIGRIDKRIFDLKLGHKKIPSPTVRSFTVSYGGLLGKMTDYECKLVYKEFMRLLKDGKADVIRLNYLSVNSHLYNLALTMPGFLSQDRFPVFNTHWQMDLPDRMEAFYKSRSSKHRYWLRRLDRIIERDFPNQVKYIIYGGNSNLSKVFTDAEIIAYQTYQRGLHVGFIDNEQTRKNYSFLAKKERFRAYMMYIKDKPCAFWLGEHYKNTFYLYSTGYIPGFKKYEIGTVLFVKMLEDLCSSGDIKYLDFGFGDAPYKSRFGDKSWEEASIYIFSRKFNGLKLNFMRLLTSGTYSILIKLLIRFHVLEKVKKLRRRKMIENAKKE